jgi:outer membrane protein assembly factor BamA
MRPSLRLRRTRQVLGLLVALVLLGALGGVARAELVISQVIVSGNAKTSQRRIEQIMGITAGDRITFETLERARVELSRAQLFDNIRVELGMTNEKAGSVMYVPKPVEMTELLVFLKEKHSWFGFPFGSFSSDNKAVGGVFLDQNLFGTAQKILAAGQYGQQTTFGFLSWRNPSIFGSRLAADAWGLARTDIIPFYRHHQLVQQVPVKDFGGALLIGGYWTRDFSSWIGGSYRYVLISRAELKPGENYVYYRVPMCNQPENINPATCTLPGDMRGSPKTRVTQGSGNDVEIRIRLTYDNRNVENEVYQGTLINLENTVGDQFLLSSFDFLQFRLNVQQFFRYAKRWSTAIKAVAGLSYATGSGGIPVMNEFAYGGTELRGSFFREFRGDTVFISQFEQQVRMFNAWRLAFHGVAFYDIGLIYYRHPQGVESTRGASIDDLHHGIGGGLRIFIRGVALPAFAIDVAYGIDVRSVAYYFSLATGNL